MNGEPHDRYFALTPDEQRQVRELLARKVRAGKALDRDLIETAINVVTARRSWKRGAGRPDDPHGGHRRSR